ncbi:hypothetical protein Dvar_36380 [Desulfosarcina variabilis str. Montpellier]|uniref:hypothetical protein n=1 Tax=Desulfosarcina variabilis TaxID=2300 RepID=UPI003AFA1353
MNLEKFKQANFERRTATVPVPALSAFFDDGQKAELTVQGLTGQEIARARERIQQNTAINELVEKIVSEKASSKIEGLQQALGLTDEVPNDLVYRIAICEFGVVSVNLEQEDCVKLAANCPETFYQVTSKILSLTGMGQVPQGELIASGTTQG